MQVPWFNVLVAAALAAGLKVFDSLNRSRLSTDELRRGADRAVLLAGLLVLSAALGSIGLSNVLDGRLPFALPWSFTFYGGALVALAAFPWLVRRFRLPPGETVDHLAIALSIGHAIGRIGCHVGGCCYGRMCAPDATLRALALPSGRIPVQLMEATAELANFLVLIVLWRSKRLQPGAIAALWLVIYGVERLLLEWLRDDPRGSVSLLQQWGLSPSQGLAIMAIAGGGVWIAWMRITRCMHRAHLPPRPPA